MSTCCFGSGINVSKRFTTSVFIRRRRQYSKFDSDIFHLILVFFSHWLRAECIKNTMRIFCAIYKIFAVTHINGCVGLIKTNEIHVRSQRILWIIACHRDWRELFQDMQAQMHSPFHHGHGRYNARSYLQNVNGCWFNTIGFLESNRWHTDDMFSQCYEY